MIKRKVGICPKCPPGSSPRGLISGLCQFHYWLSRQQIKSRKPKAEDKTPLGPWFDYHNNRYNWNCENCNILLNPYSPQVASSCQAHILPKKLFDSVKNVLENHMLLGGMFQECHCHKKFDSSWETAAEMPVFQTAIIRVKSFYHLIHPSEYKFLPQQLLIHL